MDRLNTRKAESQDLSVYYLQRVTKELAEDLNKVRTTADFKPESIHHLIYALQQGSLTITSNTTPVKSGKSAK